jgi:hypothetical protein
MQMKKKAALITSLIVLALATVFVLSYTYPRVALGLICMCVLSIFLQGVYELVLIELEKNKLK